MLRRVLIQDLPKGKKTLALIFREFDVSQDTQLLCTDVKPFMSALPYAFLTHDWNYVPTTVVTESTIPPGLHISKQFLKAHADEILKEWEHVKSLGKPAADEWSKGLAGTGKYTMTDAARWERWETKGGLNGVLFMLTPQQPQVTPPVYTQMAQPTPSQPWGANQFSWPQTSSQPQFFQPQPISMAQQPFHHTSTTAGPQHYFQTSPAGIQNPFPQPGPISTPHGQTPGAYGQPPNLPQTQTPQHRVERNARDATEAKYIRRKAIVERCVSDIDPPLPENVLRHMESFQAATQISARLTDGAWEVLKPRLIAQRPAAEAMEREHTAQLLALQAQVNAENKRNIYSKEAKDAQEREWEEALKPQREKLSSYADQYVKQHWKGGHSINSGNVALFAISVFNHVRKQFYTELEVQDRLAMVTGQPIPTDLPDGPFLRRLTLETMKWVYDNKIRPLTRDFGKEIFYCNGDGCESNSKLYAFEGVIQHYGAKHTNNFSKGNVIIHWQTADWPEDLPFFDPGSGPTTRYSHHTNGGFSRGTTITPQVTSSAPFSVPSLTTSPYTPLSGYGHGPFPPPIGAANGFSPPGHHP
ncbi:hypothetical protein NA57DRAFT_38703, partial [Rhizodiscina lignyota]